MVMTYKTVRVFFKKLDRCIYISHLDLMRAMGRAVSRSGIDAWYTMGFNPHLYMTFALPLSLGTSSICESMDFRISPDENIDTVVARLNAALPEGLEAYDACEPLLEPKEIMWADYEIALCCDPSATEDALHRLCNQSQVLMEKRSKKGMKDVDIRPMFSLLRCEQQQRELKLLLRCRAGVEINLNPSLVLEALEKYQAISVVCAKITRVAVLTEKLYEFR